MCAVNARTTFTVLSIITRALYSVSFRYALLAKPQNTGVAKLSVANSEKHSRLMKYTASSHALFFFFFFFIIISDDRTCAPTCKHTLPTQACMQTYTRSPTRSSFGEVKGLN